MIYKNLNSYLIRHKNGATENISAETASSAITSSQIAETESKIDSLLLTGENIRVAIEEQAEVSNFTTEVNVDGYVGTHSNRAFPENLTGHIGDKVKVSVVVDDRFNFDGWYNEVGVRLSQLTTYEHTLSAKTEKLTAKFKLANVSFTCVRDGGDDSCVVYPDSFTAQANAEIKLLAIASTGYIFQKWTRNGADVSTQAKATINLLPREASETVVVYKAVFTSV